MSERQNFQPYSIGKRGEVEMNLTPNRLMEISKITKEIQRLTMRELSFSETRSLQSHIPVRKFSWGVGGLKKLSSREAIVLCLQLTNFHKDWKYAIWFELFQLPKKYQYQGVWNIVHMLLRNRDSLERMVFILLGNGYTAREIFGMLNDKNLHRLKNINLYDPHRTKVNYPQRKRGYNDHGSRKDSHKWLPWNAYATEDIPKIDKEKELIQLHPFLHNVMWNRIKSHLSTKPTTKEKSICEKQTNSSSVRGY